MTDVLMPALSPTMEEGTLAKWHVKVGDAVKSGDVIAEIETDKATMEVEAVDEGVVEELLVPEGTEEVKVNTPIARLKGEGARRSPCGEGSGVGAAASPQAAERRSRRPIRRVRAQRLAKSYRKPRPPTPPPRGSSPNSSTRKSPPAPSWCGPRCAMRCATPWPRRCGAIRTCS